MNGKNQPSKWKRVISGVVLIASTLIAGAAFGILWVRLFIPRKAMGWDNLADFLGGMMVGALLGLVVGAVMVFLFSIRTQWMSIGIAVVVAILIFASLALTAPDNKSSMLLIAKKPQSAFRGEKALINQFQLSRNFFGLHT